MYQQFVVNYNNNNPEPCFTEYKLYSTKLSAVWLPTVFYFKSINLNKDDIIIKCVILYISVHKIAYLMLNRVVIGVIIPLLL